MWFLQEVLLLLENKFDLLQWYHLSDFVRSFKLPREWYYFVLVFFILFEKCTVIKWFYSSDDFAFDKQNLHRKDKDNFYIILYFSHISVLVISQISISSAQGFQQFSHCLVVYLKRWRHGSIVIWPWISSHCTRTIYFNICGYNFSLEWY